MVSGRGRRDKGVFWVKGTSPRTETPQRWPLCLLIANCRHPQRCWSHRKLSTNEWINSAAWLMSWAFLLPFCSSQALRPTQEPCTGGWGLAARPLLPAVQESSARDGPRQRWDAGGSSSEQVEAGSNLGNTGYEIPAGTGEGARLLTVSQNGSWSNLFVYLILFNILYLDLQSNTF